MRIDARKIAADLLPRFPAIARAHHELIRVIQRFVGRGKNLRQCPGFPIGIVGIGGRQFASQRSGDIQRLIAAAVAVAVENVAVFRIGHNGSAFARQTSWLPIAEAQDTFTRGSTDADAAAILLRAVEPVRKAIVGGHMIDLRGGLVVPGAPSL